MTVKNERSISHWFKKDKKDKKEKTNSDKKKQEPSKKIKKDTPRNVPDEVKQ